MSRAFHMFVLVVVGLVSCGACGCAATVADSTINTPSGTVSRHFDETGYGDKTYTETVDIKANGFGGGMMGFGPSSFPSAYPPVYYAPASSVPEGERAVEGIAGGPVIYTPTPLPASAKKGKSASISREEALALATALEDAEKRLKKLETQKKADAGRGGRVKN
ncbi:hypothetical protein KJ781_00070 [Patescibacteria group bacterium]|nr:hypothetical protein [Patescibacteria group bacterium]MBU1448581.1 hypothetical protein [Patescibacteria group bacterium]MBU2613438.1 hypothetical protein [Patescibacteria group bacterium]